VFSFLSLMEKEGALDVGPSAILKYSDSLTIQYACGGINRCVVRKESMGVMKGVLA